ncbi:MAG: two-component system, cell cycle sensor histidine kinase and response regulator CckA, partial [Acidobacteriota bacterium]|nr:two-component system, cell cycle sensor histidine kinase and response regulator CckA [Acidobacteriota bacterium]
MDDLLRVLIVEDSAADTELLVREIERGGYRVTSEQVQTASAFHDALANAAWDVVISDYDLPVFSGPAALGILKASGLDLPFIMISGTISEDIAVSALKAGAHDFLVKGRLARLIPAIERECREVGVRRERARAEDALRRSEAQYRSLVDGAVFGICQTTDAGHFVSVNPALVTMLGYESAADLLRVNIASLYEDRDVAATLISRSFEPVPLAGEEVLWRCKDGREIRVRLSGRLIEEPQTGRPLAEMIVEDITDQHRLQAQFRQAQKMEAIGQLAGGVAHDFNNMLTAILGYSEMLSDQIGPDKPMGQDLREITAAGQRAAALTKQLLAFSRKQVFSTVAVDLTRIVRTVEPMLQRLLGERITIRTALADDLVSVMADSAQLEHLLINLAVNARDAMPDGGVLTFATANVVLDETFARNHPGAVVGCCAMVSVADTGTGMTPDVQARIFEPFFTTKESGRGTGLGLAATYGTVKQLGGYIEVDSELHRGTTFSVYLPRAVQRAEALPATALVGTHVGDETILVVEDESGVRTFVTTALRRFGYRVMEAETAEAALLLLESYSGRVHLLLT